MQKMPRLMRIQNRQKSTSFSNGEIPRANAKEANPNQTKKQVSKGNMARTRFNRRALIITTQKTNGEKRSPVHAVLADGTSLSQELGWREWVEITFAGPQSIPKAEIDR